MWGIYDCILYSVVKVTEKVVKKKKSLPCHPTANAKLIGNGIFTAYWAYVQSRNIRCSMLHKNKMGANRRPWDFLCDTLNLVWGHFWASCGHRDLPGSVCSLVQLEHVSLRLLGSWNTLIIGHPSAKCCYQSVISCLWPPSPCVAIKSSYWIVYSWLTWGAHGRDKTFIMSPYQR